MATGGGTLFGTSPKDVVPEPHLGNKLPRILACEPCQRRKLKCTRKLPCSNCVKTKTECVPGTLARRKRRFPERTLLQRIRRYEQLLQENRVAFQPLHESPAGEDVSSHRDTTLVSEEEHLDDTKTMESSLPSSTTRKEARNIWQFIDQGIQDTSACSDLPDDGQRGLALKKAINAMFDTSNSPLFAFNTRPTDLSAAHPDPVQIFRLWDIYVANVSPLLKVIHTPTVQRLVINAASDLRRIDPNTETLMFSIYSIAAVSLDPENCKTIFGAPKQDLTARFQAACWQALLNAKLLRTGNRDCLVAFYLYLMSVLPTTDPSSVSSMLGVAVRIARHMGLHSEAACAKVPAFEGEMRRRLWWSLMLLDSRVAEMACQQPSELLPSWDCRMPLDLSDSVLRPDAKELPRAHSKCTEALFLVVSCELAALARRIASRAASHNATVKSMANALGHDDVDTSDDIRAIQALIEERYFRHCDDSIPAQFTIIRMTRGYLAKLRLLQHYAQLPNAASSQTEDWGEKTNLLALTMLESDTNVVVSPLTKGFLWFIRFHFPFLAYIHLAQDLRRRPISEHADRAWEAIGDNYFARRVFRDPEDGQLFRLLAGIILQAWEPRETMLRQQGDAAPTPPSIVLHFQQSLACVPYCEASGQRGHNSNNVPPTAAAMHPTFDAVVGSTFEAANADYLQNCVPGLDLFGSSGFGEDALIHADTLSLAWPFTH